jgi:hypothetical protein
LKFTSAILVFSPQQRKAEEDAKKKHETEMDYLAPFLAQIGDPSHLSRAEAYKLKEECLQDLKQRLIDRANLIQARFEKVEQRYVEVWAFRGPVAFTIKLALLISFDATSKKHVVVYV